MYTTSHLLLPLFFFLKAPTTVVCVCCMLFSKAVPENTLCQVVWFANQNSYLIFKPVLRAGSSSFSECFVSYWCFPYFLFDLLWYIHLLTQVGTLRFCGSTEFSGGLWAGVELDKPEGKNDGSVAGVQYFNCRNKHGRSRPVLESKNNDTQLLPYLD